VKNGFPVKFSHVLIINHSLLEEILYNPLIMLYKVASEPYYFFHPFATSFPPFMISPLTVKLHFIVALGW
jgi:hypothetical protein